MKSIQRYLVAKYIPDIRRKEPVNIGIVIWASGRTASRFLSPEEATGLVRDGKTYQRWLDYWQKLLTQPTIEPLRGSPVPKDAPEFLDVFAQTQKDNYLLVDEGIITDKVPAKHLNSAADYLFEQLVARKGLPTSPREQKAKLKAICSRLFADAGLSEREDFQRSFPVECQVRRIHRRFQFDYAVANGVLSAVYQRVQLPTTQSVNSATLMFEHIQESHNLDVARCAAIVQVDKQTSKDADSDEAKSLEMLREFATVIDVTDYDTAISQIVQVAKLAQH